MSGSPISRLAQFNLKGSAWPARRVGRRHRGFPYCFDFLAQLVVGADRYFDPPDLIGVDHLANARQLDRFRSALLLPNSAWRMQLPGSITANTRQAQVPS
jgi:hypothetical protein